MMPQIIEWAKPAPEDVMFVHPSETIEWGSVLVVNEQEVAVFFRDGKCYDVFGPGRHVLTTLNLPLLTGILSKIVGYGQSPFRASIVFVSTKEFNGKFGFRAQTTDLAPLMAHGGYWFKVEDPTIFITELAGRKVHLSSQEVTDFIRGYLNEVLIDSLSKNDLATVFTRLDETSLQARTTVQDALKRFGLLLVDMKFEGLDTEPEYRERLFFIKQVQSGTAASEVLRMDTAKAMAKELGKSPGAGLGAGMVLIPQVMTPQPSQAAVASVICPSCGKYTPANSNFCMNCGAKLQQQPPPQDTKVCSKCNTKISAEAKFCPNCGAQQS
jgi:membrane protease subunit (stomatin/prohibitin family)